MLSNFIDRIRLLFCKERESYLCFYKILGFFPHNIKLYEQAFVHKSTFIKADNGQPINNERLEFLGDAILDAVVGHIVYQHFERKGEGFLTNTRSKIVQRETLNKLALNIGLDKLMKYSLHQSSHNNYLYGNAFEAFIGAIYLDRGYDLCKLFIESRIISKFINLEQISRKEVNFKSHLIEWGQKHKIEIYFDLILQSKDDAGNPIFESEVRASGMTVGRGKGYSKKESQQVASKIALNKVHAKNFISDLEAFTKRLRRERYNASLPMVIEPPFAIVSTETDAHSLSLDN